MKFIEIFVEVLKNFGDFKTRTNRTDFWIFILISIVLSMLIGMLSFTLSYVFDLIILIPSLAVGARRLHDVGKSGLTQLWMLTIVGIIYLIVLWAQEGEHIANKWGEVPEVTEL